MAIDNENVIDVGHSDKETTAYYDHNKQIVDMESLKHISLLGVV